MTHSESTNLPRRAADILEYFLRNPQAADSLEGVARWRLLEDVVRRNVEEVGRSLELLVHRGFLIQHTTIGSEPIFSLNKTRLADAERMLERPRPSTSRRKRQRAGSAGHRRVSRERTP